MILNEQDGDDLVVVALNRAKTGSLARQELLRFKSGDANSESELIFPDGLPPSAIPNLVFVTTLDDLPVPNNGVIHLKNNTSYYLTTILDLRGNRLVADGNVCIWGGDPDMSGLLSTGLTGTALLTTNYSCYLRFISITADIGINFDATGNPNQVTDLLDIHFDNCNSVGTVKGFSNFTAFKVFANNSGALTFDGSLGSISFSHCFFDGKTAGTSLAVLATATIQTVFRLIHCNFELAGGETGINFSALATTPVESYVLYTCTFNGAGTGIAGVAATDNKTLFSQNKGIANSTSVAQYYAIGNATSTTVTQNVYTKALGTTTPGTLVSKFDLSVSNRATYIGAMPAYFKVTAIVGIAAQVNRIIGIKIALDGTPIADSQVLTDAQGTGTSTPVTSQTILSMAPNSYVEIWVTNTTNSTAVVVESMNLIIEKLT